MRADSIFPPCLRRRRISPLYLRVRNELDVDDDVFCGVDREVDHVAGMQVLDQVGRADTVHHFHRRHEALDLVMRDRQRAGRRRDHLDDAVPFEEAGSGLLLLIGRSGGKPEGKRQRSDSEPRPSHRNPPASRASSIIFRNFACRKRSQATSIAGGGRSQISAGGRATSCILDYGRVSRRLAAAPSQVRRKTN